MVLVAGAVAWMASPTCHLNGCLVRASDGRLTLSRVTDLAARDLGDAAADPAIAGAALAEMAGSAVA